MAEIDLNVIVNDKWQDSLETEIRKSSYRILQERYFPVREV